MNLLSSVQISGGIFGSLALALCTNNPRKVVKEIIELKSKIDELKKRLLGMRCPKNNSFTIQECSLCQEKEPGHVGNINTYKKRLREEIAKCSEELRKLKKTSI